MKFITGLTVFFVLYFSGSKYNADAALAMGVYHSDAHPGKCAYSDTLILSPGEDAKSPHGCARISCFNADGMVQIATCGVAAPPPGCEWGDYIDEAAPYGKCCERHMICT